MAKQTKEEKVVEFLKSRGLVEILPSKSRKYRQFKKADDSVYSYWVGRKGACRKGKISSQSISITLTLL